ncbi:MAG: fumarate hydratase [Sphingobacteriaceae bacterium]
MYKSFCYFSFVLIGLCCVFSCKFNSPIQGSGADFLQGRWIQDALPLQKQLVNYSLYAFNFNCDSFFVRINTFSKVQAAIDTCMHRGEWTEYAKGSYVLQNDTLYLKGFFANADSTLKNEGCLRTGVFNEAFSLTSKRDSSLLMKNLSDVIPISLRLVEKSGCIPKLL